MALIRITKRVAIVLCCGAVVLLGVCVLKGGRSVSHERSEVLGESPPEVRVLVEHDPEEIVELRDRNTRVYKVIREVQVMDPVTREVRIEQVESRIIEKANNLCYRDEWGSFVPSVAEFETVSGGFVADRNNFGLGVGESLAQGLTATFDQVPVTMRPAYLVLFDGARALTLANADPGTLGQLDVNDPSVVRFPRAFGDLADLEYIVRKGGYHQNVVIHRPIALPAGFDPDESQILVYSEISYDDLVSNRGVKASNINGEIDLSTWNSASALSEEQIAFQAISPEGRAVHLFSFGESEVWDSAPDPEEEKRTMAGKQLFRSEERVTYLLERVYHSFLSDAHYPVVVDYVVETGSMTEDETWTPPNTYYISDGLTVSGATLTIRPGTTVKYENGVNAFLKIQSSGCIKAEGTAYDYITFTSKKDDSSGEDLTDTSTSGSRGDYKYGIYLAPSASTSCVIKYCKIGYAYYGILNYIINSSSLAPIENNIIAHCYYGLHLFRPAHVNNNLITDCTTRGIYAVYNASPSYTARISNNTIDSSSRGIYCYLSTLTAKYNLFSNCYYAVYRQYGTVTLNYNGYYHNTYSNDVYGCSKGGHHVTLPDDDYPNDSPYDTSPLGDFYLKDSFTQLKNKPNLDPEMGFDGYVYTTQKPDIAPTSISSNTTWTKVDYETTTTVVDIGYHHNRVDKLLNNANTTVTSATLTMTSGVAVAIKGYKYLRISSNAKLVCEGDPWEGGHNVIARDTAVSAKIESPAGRSQSAGYVWLLSNSSNQSSIRYTRFRWLGYGLRPTISLAAGHEIEHNSFEFSYYGCVPVDCSNTFKNNLYYGNLYGLRANLFTTKSYNNTFDSNDVGIWLARYYQLENAEVKDSLFTNNGQGIRRTGPSGGLTTDYNGFHGNGENIWDAEASQALDIGSNSLVVVSSPYDPGVSPTDWHRLDQTCPLINAGSVQANSRGLDTFTTDKDGEPDANEVDIGYHYPLDTEDPGWTNFDITNQYFDRTQTTATISLTYTGGSGNWTLTIIIPAAPDKVYTDSTTTVNQSWDGTDGNNNPVSDGSYTFTLARTGTRTITGFLVVDTTDPNILTIDHPESGETVRGH